MHFVVDHALDVQVYIYTIRRKSTTPNDKERKQNEREKHGP